MESRNRSTRQLGVNLTPYTLYPINPEPYTLRPKSQTLNLTLYTLYHKP